ncbi:MAG: YHS domain-containing protein [Thermoplasmatota archaeon]
MKSSSAKVRDPVCNCLVDATTPKFSSHYDGQTYHFCAEGCRRAFEANPRQYVGQPKLGQLPIIKE